MQQLAVLDQVSSSYCVVFIRASTHFLLWTEENLFLIEATQKALVWHIESKNIVDVTNLNNGLMIYLDEK